MTNFISGWDLLKEWNIRDFELFEYVNKGKLQPFNKIGRPVPHPDYRSKGQINEWRSEIKSLKKSLSETRSLIKKTEKYHFSVLANINENLILSRIKNFEDKIERYKNYSTDPYNWTNYNLPENEDEAKEILSLICNCLYHNDIAVKISITKEEDKKKETNNVYYKHEKLIVIMAKEAETIYNFIVKKIGVTDKSIKSRSERRDAAIDFINNHPGEFKNIKEEHLRDLYIFDFNSSQSKRDYMRRILKIIMEDHFPEKTFSGAKLFDIYRSTKRPI